MWEADEAWGAKLRGVTLAALAETLKQDIPATLLQSSLEWVLKRAG
jgi:hypothetical protein